MSSNRYEDRFEVGFANDSTDDIDYVEDEEQSRGCNDREIAAAIGRKETQAVRGLRWIVLLVLVASAIGVAVTAYLFVRGSEQARFEAQFTNDADKILDAIGSSMARTLGLFDSLAVTLVSSAQATNQSWPFTTVPNFGMRMSKILPLSDAFVISILPLVSSEPRERRAWEAYSLENDDWVDENIALQATWDGFHGPIVEDWERRGVIYGDNGDIPLNVSRVLLPQWQTFPSIPKAYSAYNWDWLSDSAPETVLASFEKRRAVLSEAYMIPAEDDLVAQAETADWAEWHRDYLPPTENPIEPVSDIYYPVVEELNRVEQFGASSDSQERASSSRVVAVLMASFYWREMLYGILPTDSNGVVLVVRNPCNLDFTYQIDGEFAIYLGVGDHHDKSYEGLAIVRHQADLKAFSLTHAIYSGAPMDTELCPFSFHVYPSATMQARYTSKNPIIFTVAATMIFAFTWLVFYLYDKTVEKRQRTVLKSATSASAIVSSLFPAAVRAQLFDLRSNSKKNIETFLRQEEEDRSKEFSRLGRPIAELYNDTTVFFADIAGFTAWSSQRTPTEVFHLLETLYCAFDSVAKRRRVFKVETIGDSYVAVVGLPTPRKRHAEVMVRFAVDCLQKMAEVTAELSDTLGPDTADLALRIGLNSGPTTAGVLRGEKSRFQLFGDTVNTASRMESSSERNRIHVSAKTAELLTASGKEHWLLERESPIDVKGKGQMQTYWCEPWSRGDFMAYLAAMDGNESMCDTICAEERMGGFETASGSDSENDAVNDDDGEVSIASHAEVSKDELESPHMEQAPPRPATQRS